MENQHLIRNTQGDYRYKLQIWLFYVVVVHGSQNNIENDPWMCGNMKYNSYFQAAMYYFSPIIVPQTSSFVDISKVK
jgi:hypothetical protein